MSRFPTRDGRASRALSIVRALLVAKAILLAVTLAGITVAGLRPSLVGDQQVTARLVLILVVSVLAYTSAAVILPTRRPNAYVFALLINGSSAYTTLTTGFSPTGAAGLAVNIAAVGLLLTPGARLAMRVGRPRARI